MIRYCDTSDEVRNAPQILVKSSSQIYIDDWDQLWGTFETFRNRDDKQKNLKKEKKRNIGITLSISSVETGNLSLAGDVIDAKRHIQRQPLDTFRDYEIPSSMKSRHEANQ